MKFLVATLSLLVIFALTGSIAALIMGAGGYLPDVSVTPLSEEAKGGALMQPPHQATVPLSR